MNSRNRRPEPRPEHLPLSPAEIGAIAIDTNIYREYGFRVREQPLRELAEVGSLGIRWLVPEFWERELQRHMLVNAEKTANLRRDLAKARDWVSRDLMGDVEKLVSGLETDSPERVVDRLIGEHFKAGNPVRLRTAWSLGPDVLNAYFESRDPFEPSGAKKSEFPDAFALATLVAWAEKNETKVLVVTHDAGCLRACRTSSHLMGMESLTEALGALRKADKARKTVIEEYEHLLICELRDEVSELRKQIDAVIESQLPDEELDIQFEVESNQDCDHELTYVRVDRIELAETVNQGSKLRVFAATVGELSFECEFRVRVDAEARFARVYPGNRSSSNFNSASPVFTSGSVDVEAIITLQPTGALSAKTLAHATVRRVELRVQDVDLDFGEVEAYEPNYEE